MSMTPSQLAAAVNAQDVPQQRPYVQLYTANICNIRKLMARSPAAADILFAMLEIMGRRNSLVASIASLMRISQKSKSTVLRALDLLQESHFIQRTVVDGAYVYTVNDAVAWKDKTAYRGKMACFDAKVLTFEDEQPGGLPPQATKLKKVAKLS